MSVIILYCVCCEQESYEENCDIVDDILYCPFCDSVISMAKNQEENYDKYSNVKEDIDGYLEFY